MGKALFRVQARKTGTKTWWGIGFKSEEPSLAISAAISLVKKTPDLDTRIVCKTIEDGLTTESIFWALKAMPFPDGVHDYDNLNDREGTTGEPDL